MKFLICIIKLSRKIIWNKYFWKSDCSFKIILFLIIFKNCIQKDEIVLQNFSQARPIFYLNFCIGCLIKILVWIFDKFWGTRDAKSSDTPMQTIRHVYRFSLVKARERLINIFLNTGQITCLKKSKFFFKFENLFLLVTEVKVKH